MSTSYWSRLGEIDFSHTIERLVEGFTGREWLFKSLDNWLNQEDGEKFYLLTGEPGVGKSAIAARLTQRWIDDNPEAGKLAAYHFCRAGDVETVRPGRVVRSLAAQLVNTLPRYKEALKEVIDPVYLNIKSEINIGTLSNSQVTGIYIENLKNLDPREEFRLLIQAPLAALSNIYTNLGETPPSVKVLLIDSLDEAATTTGQENMVTLLASLYQVRETLPPWIRFLLTARPDQSVLTRFLPLKAEKIEELEAKNLSDIQRYIQGRVDSQLRVVRSTPEPQINNALVSNLKPLQQRLEEANLTPEKLVNEVKELSHGNFLYTKLLLNSIELGEQSIKNLSALPKNLNDIYHRILRYRCSFRGWLKRYQPILGVLSVAQESITLEQLTKFIGITPEELKQDLEVFQQFLDQSEDEQGEVVYSIFHQSLREYLLDKQNHDFWCDAKEQHDSVINYFENESKEWKDLEAIDLYGLRHLAQHLAKGDRIEDLHTLLSLEKDGKNAWFKLKDAAGDIAGFLADVTLAWELAEKNWTEATLPQVIEKQCRYVLILSSLNSLSDIPTELLEALVKAGTPYGWTVEQGLAYTRQIPDEAKRAEGLKILTHYLPDKQTEKMWQEVLTVAQAIQDESSRAEVLISLAAHLPQRLYEEALTAAQAIQDESSRAEVLISLAAHFPEAYEEALTAAQAIRDESSRAKVLISLAAHFPEACEEALTTAQAIQDEYYRAGFLISLAAHLPQRLYEKALTAAQVIQDESYRSEVLIGLAAHFPEAYKSALTAALTLKYEHTRTRALDSLAERLPQRLYEEARMTAQAVQDKSCYGNAVNRIAAHFPKAYEVALTAALAIQNESTRAEILISLAPYLPQKLYQEVLIATLAIQDESTRADVLSSLVSHLPQELYKEALTAAQAIQDECACAQVLSGLAAYFPEVLHELALTAALAIQEGTDRNEILGSLATLSEAYEPALTAALAIQGEYVRAKALIGLAARFPEVCEPALTAALAIQNESTRADVLSSLVLHLPQQLYKEALTAALAISFDYARVQALSSLAAHFPDVYKEALTTAQAIQDDYVRTMALSSLAAHFPDVYKEALTTAQAIQDEYYRAEALSSLAAHLPEACEPALTAALAIQDESSRANVLGRLAPYLPQQLYEPALLAAQAIQDESSRATALSSLTAAHLPQRLYKPALSAAQAIQDESSRARVLIGLAANFPEACEPALTAALAIQDESSRANALGWLAPHLPQQLYEPALLASLAIQDKYYLFRAYSLKELTRRCLSFPISRQFTIWQKILRAAVKRKRPELLSDLNASVSLIAKLSGEVGGIASAETVQQVAKWWK